MTSHLASSALCAVLAATVSMACSGDGSSTSQAAGGSETQAGGATHVAGSSGKSSATAGDSNLAGDGSSTVGGAGGGVGGKGGGAGGAGGAGPSGPQADAFWRDFAAALCHRYFHCPDETDPEAHSRLRALAKTEARCSAFLLEHVLLTDPHVTALNAGVAAGVLHLQQSRIQTCLDTAKLCAYPLVAPNPGEVTLQDVATCREVFEGTVATQGNCDLAEECQGDSMCVRSSGGKCAGHCAPRAGENMACSGEGQCASAPDQWAACSTLKCATFDVGTPAADGSECTQHSNQDLCHDDSWCAAGQACAPAVALNDTCDLAMPGIDVCLDGRCDSGKCTAFTVGTKAGDTCSMATAPCDAFASLACVAGKCAAASGSNCTEYYWFDRALCTPAARRAAGATCSTSAQCQSGICRPQTGCAASLCSAP